MIKSTSPTRRAILKGAICASALATCATAARSDSHFDLPSGGRSFDLGDFLVGDGVTDNNLRFDLLLAHMADNPGAAYRGHNGDRYACSFTQRFVPDGIRLILEGAQFLWGGDLSGSRASILRFGENVTFDTLRWRFLPGARFERALEFGHRTRGDLVELVSDVQIYNSGESNLDAAVQLYGSDIAISAIEVENIDRAILVYHQNAPAENIRINSINVRSYSRGLMLRNVKDFTLGTHQLSGRSPNAAPDPGHNGLLLAGVQSATFGPGYVRDAGEHGYRVGGSAAGELETQDISFASPKAIGAGQCGFKSWPGEGQGPIRGLSVTGGLFIDCGNKPGVLGFNDFGMMIQNVTDGIIEGCSVTARDQSACAYDGFYVSGPTRVQLNGCSSYRAVRNSLRISEFNNHGETRQAVNTLNVRGFLGQEHGAEGIVVEAPSEAMRDIFVADAHLIGGTTGILFDGAAEQARQPCYFSALVRGQSGEEFDVPASPNIKVVDLLD